MNEPVPMKKTAAPVKPVAPAKADKKIVGITVHFNSLAGGITKLSWFTEPVEAATDIDFYIADSIKIASDEIRIIEVLGSEIVIPMSSIRYYVIASR